MIWSEQELIVLRIAVDDEFLDHAMKQATHFFVVVFSQSFWENGT